ncbi:MAG TPA: outer membrane beta-barrel protein [Gemmatimonadaceae bacterium]|nr:outer membrane beta-barrel protein [Gemmatimonadaceae bacterium]
MKTRISVLYALGLAAAMTLGAVPTASAQKKTTTKRRAVSQKRIPVRKEVPVAAPRVDTVTVTRVDTVTVRRTDTVSTTVVRYDTVTRMVYPPLQRLPGLFFGVGAGANIPMNNIRAVFKDGYALQGQVGYFPNNSPLGLRVDGTWGKLNHYDSTCPQCLSPNVWTVGGDVILRMPLDRTSKLNPVLYAFGGGGWSHFGDINTTYQLVNAGGNPNKQADLAGGHAYWDVGPGVDFSVGNVHFYAEGRYMTIFTKALSPQSENLHSHMFPVYGGIKIY